MGDQRRRSKRGERLPPPPPPAPPAPAPARPPDRPDPDQKSGRGRPSAKVGGLSVDKAARADLETAIVQLERDMIAAVALPDAGTIDGQARIAGLSARVWTLRSLAVTDVTTRALCEKNADLARTSLARLERALGSTRTKILIESMNAQRGTADRLQSLGK